MKEAKAMSKMAVWKWASTSNVFTSLPLRVSRAIEKEYEVIFIVWLWCKTMSEITVLFADYLGPESAKIFFGLRVKLL